MKQRILVYIMSALFLLQGCRKDKDDDVTISVINADLNKIKDYSYFLPGTYWVYQDSLTGIEDSVYVFYSNIGRDTVTQNGETKVHDFFNVKTQSTFYQFSFIYWMHTSWSNYDLNGNIERNKIFRDKTQPGNYVGQTIFMMDRFVNGDIVYPFTQDGVVSFKGLFDSVTINNLTFYSVVKFNDSENITEGKTNTNFYIGKNVGIIRRKY